MLVDGSFVEIVDLPGLYSLKPLSEDEIVATEALLGKLEGESKPALIICVLDASNLERHLYLFARVAELQLPTMVVLTMVDILEKEGRKIDVDKLSALLSTRAYIAQGHKKSSLSVLAKAIAENLDAPSIPPLGLGLHQSWSEPVRELRERLARSGIDAKPSQIVAELGQPGSEFGNVLEEAPELKEAFLASAQSLPPEATVSPNADIKSIYSWAREVSAASTTAAGRRQLRTSDKIDRILTHKVYGLAVFVGMMYLVFQSIYTFAQPIMDLITSAFGGLSAVVSPHLKSIPILQSLVCDGLLQGVGAMLVFLPQILILFFFISVLEGTGYLARAAFLMDKLLSWCGLNGRAFIPLLSSFACAIPGIMAARVMPDKKSRLVTILVSPLMSCSARLPVYLLLIGAFIEPRYGAFWAGFSLFAMHFLGLLVAIPIAWFLNRKVIKGKRLPFFLELPPYQAPRWRDVGISMYSRGKLFVKTAGTTIVATSVVIWALSYFPRPSVVQVSNFSQEQLLERSYLGRMGKAIAPVFKPAGFDWRITTGILASFPARENVVPSLGILFKLGKNIDGPSVDLRHALVVAKDDNGSPILNDLSAVGLMVFFALCCQCMSTLATVKRETNSYKWPIFMFSYMTALAYVGAVAVFQLGNLLNR